MGVDIGTTNWKVGLFLPGEAPQVKSCPAICATDSSNYTVYDPVRLWEAVQGLIGRFPPEQLRRVSKVGVTGMAEAGLLVEQNDRRPLTPIWPWFDPRGVSYAEQTRDRFLCTGLPSHGKYSVFKILAMRETLSVQSAQWVGVPEYVVLRLTGVFQTDPTLAARTYAYHIQNECYDINWLNELRLSPTVFPTVKPSGSPAGNIVGMEGFSPEATASVCGHDHLLAAYACGALMDRDVFISTGTAQVIIGKQAKRPLTQADERSGLSIGPSVDGSGQVWLGSLQAAGGSVNYWKALLNKDYDQFWDLVEDTPDAPTGLLWLPYLNGRGAPQMASEASAVLAGLRAKHTVGEVYRGVLEGLAYETRRILEAGELNAERIVVSGRLSHQQPYMQMLSDVLGHEVCASTLEEASLTGAAWLAAGQRPQPAMTCYVPDARRLRIYSEIYQRYRRLLALWKELE